MSEQNQMNVNSDADAQSSLNVGLGGRVSIRTIPSCPMFCSIGQGCVYRIALICDEPRINKGNFDAKCHSINNKDLLAALSTTRPYRGSPAGL